MKLNKTYPLVEVLDATFKASEQLPKVVEEMKRDGTYSRDYLVYERIGMLSDSPFARVTLTRASGDGNRWEGYMEVTMGPDGPRKHVEIRRKWYTAVANEDYTNIKIVIPME